MAETLKFSNFDAVQHNLSDIYNIGGTEEQVGIIRDMANVFDFYITPVPEVDNLGELIGKVGPAKELQKNIDGILEVLDREENDSIELATDWVERSGIMVPVARDFYTGIDVSSKVHTAGVITGGVRNWMHRRAVVAIDQRPSETIWLAGSSRSMSTGEGDDVVKGMKESDYMEVVIKPLLEKAGLGVELLKVESPKGSEVALEFVKAIDKQLELDRNPRENTSIAVICNAGSWVQNAGQIAVAARSYLVGNSKLEISAFTDAFKLGTGKEPASEKQNPFSAASNIPRAAKALAENL